MCFMTFVVLMRRSFLFEKEQKDMFISLAQRKGTKETSTPSKFDFVFLHHDSEKSKQASLFSRCSIGSPYIGRMQLTPVRDQPLSEFWYDLRSLCPSGKSWLLNCDECRRIERAEIGDVCFWLLWLPHKPFYAFIHNPQVFPFHLVVQEAITNKFRGQFWNLHILVEHSLDTSICQSYLCAKSFKV